MHIAQKNLHLPFVLNLAFSVHMAQVSIEAKRTVRAGVTVLGI